MWLPRRRRLAAPVLIALALLAAACSARAAADSGQDSPSQPLRIMAPADPGGGWDSTARAMQQALDPGGTAPASVEVYNVGGAGGTIGLAEFGRQHAGDPHQLMVTGLVMVGAIQTNDSPVDLGDVTPVAALTTEWVVVAVPTNSPYWTMADLVDAFREDPRAISWGGGSAGGTDHVLVGRIAQEAGVDPADVDYVAHSGGWDALAAILSGGVTAGVSGLSEFAEQVEAGRLRVLAVSSEERVEGIDAPTLTESGLDVVLPNWRGVVAPPGLSDEQRTAVTELIVRMHGTQEWQDALEANGWEDFLQTGDEFDAFLAQEIATTETVLRDIGLID